jgi:dolichol kinase
LHRKGVQAEHTRKIAHSLSTLLCLSVPVFFSSHWYALLFVVGSFFILYIGKRKQFLNSIHSVERKTYGAFLLPVSIGIAYYVSVWQQDNTFFILPVIILAISDPLASYFGTTFKSKVIKSNKTLIGTLAFFLSTLIICNALLLHQPADLKMIGITFVISIIVSAIELISPNGSDNLTIPLSVIISLKLVNTIL